MEPSWKWLTLKLAKFINKIFFLLISAGILRKFSFLFFTSCIFGVYQNTYRYVQTDSKCCGFLCFRISFSALFSLTSETSCLLAVFCRVANQSWVKCLYTDLIVKAVRSSIQRYLQQNKLHFPSQSLLFGNGCLSVQIRKVIRISICIN